MTPALILYDGQVDPPSKNRASQNLTVLFMVCLLLPRCRHGWIMSGWTHECRHEWISVCLFASLSIWSLCVCVCSSLGFVCVCMRFFVSLIVYVFALLPFLGLPDRQWEFCSWLDSWVIKVASICKELRPWGGRAFFTVLPLLFAVVFSERCIGNGVTLSVSSSIVFGATLIEKHKCWHARGAVCAVCK